MKFLEIKFLVILYCFPVTYFGTYKPIKQPITIPIASDHNGVSSIFVMLFIIIPLKVPKNAPKPCAAPFIALNAILFDAKLDTLSLKPAAFDFTFCMIL